MNITGENIVLIGSILLLVSIFAGKTSFRFGVPTLLIFLAVGMLAGSEGVGGIDFDNPKVAQLIGVVSLNFILFSGGLDTNWSSVRSILGQGAILSTLGVLLTAILLGGFVYFVTDFTIYESLLLGSIVSSTDVAAVFSILRSKNLALKSNLRPTLELESGSNDPMAYVLTIAFLTLVVNQDKSFFSIIPLFLQQMIFGSIAGILFGMLSKYIMNRIRLDYEGLYFVLMISLMFITFSFTDFIGGNGFLAIYIAAVYLGNQNFVFKKTILKLYDAQAWLMQIVLFLTLGLLVFPSRIVAVAGIGLLVSIFLILVARPLSVLLCLLPFKMKMRRRLYISWVGLRGAVPIVFATYPLLAGIDQAEMIFNIVFFISVTSVMIQGTTLGPVARWLHVALPAKVKPLSQTEKLILAPPKKKMEKIIVQAGYDAIDKKIVNLNLGHRATIALIKRSDKYFAPEGTDSIREGDLLYLLYDEQTELDDFLLRLKEYRKSSLKNYE